MTNPSVACVMLANGRPEMTTRAVRSFSAQTYENRILIVWDTSETPVNIRAAKTVHWTPYIDRPYSIGELRNEAIEKATTIADIIVTCDSDDWQHPQRIEEQVRLLESSGAECVGFNECMFCYEPCLCKPNNVPNAPRMDVVCPSCDSRQRAYLYSNPRPNYAIGASLCFWRSTWQRRPFPHLPEPGNKQCGGEDAAWLEGVRCVGVSGVQDMDAPQIVARRHGVEVDLPWFEPRLICSIHGDNSQRYDLALQSPQFRRARQWDNFAREKMKL